MDLDKLNQDLEKAWNEGVVEAAQSFLDIPDVPQVDEAILDEIIPELDSPDWEAADKQIDAWKEKGGKYGS